MTKLTEWLSGISVYLALWLAFVTKQINLFPTDWDNLILFLPVFTLIAFGLYSLSVILWRVYCFNDCPEAAKEIQEQIIAARKDLEAKGLKF